MYEHRYYFLTTNKGKYYYVKTSIEDRQNGYEVIFEPRRYCYMIVKPKDIRVGSFTISKYPECSGIRILNNVFFYEKYRGLDIGTALLAEIIKQAKIDELFSVLQFTTTSAEMMRIAFKNDFILYNVFTNVVSNNVVNCYHINLNNHKENNNDKTH